MEIGVASFVVVEPTPKTVLRPTWLGVHRTPESFARARMFGLPLIVALLAAVSSVYRHWLISINRPGRPPTFRLGKKRSGCIPWVSSLIPTRALSNETLAGPSRIIFWMNPETSGDRSLTALDQIVKLCCRASGDAHVSRCKRDRLWVS